MCCLLHSFLCDLVSMCHWTVSSCHVYTNRIKVMSGFCWYLTRLNNSWSIVAGNYPVEIYIHLLRVISIQEKFPRAENFPKMSLLKVENFPLQNFFPPENLCRSITFYKIFFLQKNFLSGIEPLDLTRNRCEKCYIRSWQESVSIYSTLQLLLFNRVSQQNVDIYT